MDICRTIPSIESRTALKPAKVSMMPSNIQVTMAITIRLQLALGLLKIISTLCICNARYTPADNYLISCGSSVSASVGERIFVPDNLSTATLLTTTQSIAGSSSLNSANSVSGFENSTLYWTARIFVAPSSYSFKIKNHGRHLVRLHFFPFVYETYDLSMANFKVSTQDVVLLSNFMPVSNLSLVFKEYLLHITRDMLIITFVPQGSSGLAFINAIEVISVPDNLITDSPRTVSPMGQHLGLSMQPLQTVYRLNVGGPKVSPETDTLWRAWETDDSFLIGYADTLTVNYSETLNYLAGQATQEDGPDIVYTTARELDMTSKVDTSKQMTWQFDVEARSRYLIRLHFCDIVSKAPYQLYINVFVDSFHALDDLDLSTIGNGILAFPYYSDFVLPAGAGAGKFTISIGPSLRKNATPVAILNGLEILEMDFSTGSVVVVEPPASGGKWHLALVLVSVSGGLAFMAIAAVLVVVLRRKQKMALTLSRNQPSIPSMPVLNMFSLLSSGMSSGQSYGIPLVTLQEATNHFDEQLVIGAGGFGNVYKGAMKDGTKVAVKRGNQKSHQGTREFRNEIELLSGLRHRHLVSLIGYCDECNEMILVYEYMEKGTLKSHLYGTDLLPLSWKTRLEICIGAARGLQYLHTGFSKSIIHRDVKSANILLNEKLMAKVSDFGISKKGPELDQTHVTTAVKGSFGYLDPEYFQTQMLTDKSDVYSFGVVLIEVICARPVIDLTLPTEMVNLAEWAIKWHKRGELDQIIDQRIAGTIKPESLRKYRETVEKCLVDYGVDRPTMGEVLWDLEFALQMQEAGPDISNVYSMDQISEFPLRAYASVDHSDM